MKTWLILDCNFLCYRAFYSTGSLSYGVDPTGVLYGFLKTLRSLQDRFGTHSRTVFAWDHGKGLREQRCPGYKSTRRKKKLTDEQEEALVGMKIQVEKLKKEYLQDLGFVNSFYQKGYEADDIIASVVASTIGSERVIVSADKDLFQLLNKNVIIYNPSSDKIITSKSFKKEYGVGPYKWALVKAIAGCSTDDIPGVEGVGEKTACQYIRGELDPKGKKFKAISDQKFFWAKNLPLVRLPYEGCKSFKPKRDQLNEAAWRDLVDRFGMESLQATTRGFGLDRRN